LHWFGKVHRCEYSVPYTQNAVDLSRFCVSLRIFKTGLYHEFGVLNGCDCEYRHLL